MDKMLERASNALRLWAQEIEEKKESDSKYYGYWVFIVDPAVTIASEFRAIRSEAIKECAEFLRGKTIDLISVNPAARENELGWNRCIEFMANKILSLDKPAAPVWCKPECPNPLRLEGGKWVYNHPGIYDCRLQPVYVSDDANFCRYCGAPRPL